MSALFGNPAAMKRGGASGTYARPPKGAAIGAAQRGRFMPFRPRGAASFVSGPKNQGQAPKG